MSARRSGRRSILRAIADRQEGNLLAFTALAMVAMIGITALVVDIGFTAGQHRFMQNGADAAALAAARKLANSVSPYPAGTKPQGIPHFFGVSDATVRAAATDIADDNQNPGMTGRTTNFTVTVEYCVASSDASYSTAAGCPSPNSWVAGPTGSGRVPDGTYKVRVTVTSTITTLFGGVIGKGSTTTSAQAIAVIRGVCPETVATGNAWAMTLWDQQDFGTNPNQLFMLWGSKNPPAPPGADSNWKNVIDLSPTSRWCDGITDDYAWAQDKATMAGMVPSGTNCTPVPSDPSKNFTGTNTTWNRGAYTQDSRGGCYVGNSINPDNLATWTSATYGGTLAVGMKVPLYPKPGDGGSNVSSAIYGPANDPCSGTYFFKGVTAIDPDYPGWGRYRDVIVFTYDIPTGQGGHLYKLAGKGPFSWTDDTSGTKMGRATLVRLLHFRIYENYDSSMSRVYGRVVSPVFPPDTNPALCGTGPGIYGNVVGLGS